MKPENPKQKIIPRIFRFLFNFAGAVALIAYVSFGMGTTIQLIKVNLNKRQDISALDSIIDLAVRRGDPSAVTDWVRLRPLAETDAIIGIVTPKSADLEPGMFFEIFRRQMWLGHADDALFWMQLARFRLRYDAIRCEVPDGYKALEEIFSIVKSPKVEQMLNKNPELQKKSLRQMLDFDAKYPARNNPEFICGVIRKSTGINAPVQPEQKWEQGRQSMRLAAESFLETPDKK